ncbi:MAG: sensor histidine kinase [Bacteroidota bacterium]
MLNITDDQILQELEKRFRQNKKSLQEMQKMTNQLTEVNKKLEESEAMKTHFISNITNEIINPFAAILGLSRNILQSKGEKWEKIISMVHLIHSEAFNLDFQLKNIFAAAKIEAGEWFPEITNVDINNLIQNVIDNFKYELDKKGIKIQYSFDIYPGVEKSFYFPTDPEKLNLILSNLISNAIKFSYDKGEIIVKALLQNNNLEISVQDFGMGVSDENKKIIFNRFKRIDPGINSVNRGHGLGLSINKAIIDMLNGRLNLESTPKEKTTFSINIPPSETIDNIEGFASDGNEFLFNDDDREVF